MSNEKYIILTHNEVQRIFQFCTANNYSNVVVFDSGCGGIGSITEIALQDEWLQNKNCKRKDITDYERW